MKFILRRYSVKDILLAVLFATVLMIVSPHYYLKTEYWQQKYPLPYSERIDFYYSSNLDNSSVLTTKNTNLSNARTENGAMNDFRNAPVFFQKKYINYKFLHMVSWTIYSQKILDFQVKFPSDVNEVMIHVNHRKPYNNFTINNVNYVNKIDDRDSLLVKVPKSGILHFTSNINIPSRSPKIFSNTNYILFVIFYLIYGIISLFAVNKLSELKEQDFAKCLKNFFIKHKVEIAIFSCFFVFYCVENLWSMLHINQFCWHIFIGDVPTNLQKVLWNLTKRYHLYAFLLFYPIFDVLIFTTKNLFLSFGLVNILLASLSVMFVYKSAKLITKKTILSCILASIFGITWAQLYLSHDFDLYIYTGFYLSWFTYLVLKELKSKEYNVSNMILIAIVFALSFGVSVSNFINFLLLIIPLFLIKKDPKFIVKIALLFLILVGSFTFIKGGTSHNLFFKQFSAAKKEVKVWFIGDFKYNWEKYKNTTLTYPIIKGKHEKILSRMFFAGLASVFIISLFLMKKSGRSREELAFYAFVAMDLIYNLVINFFWCPKMGLLFSLNYFALYFVLMAYAIDIIQTSFDKKLLNITLNSILVLYFLVLLNYNHINNVEFHKDAIKRAPVTYNFLKVNNND